MKDNWTRVLLTAAALLLAGAQASAQQVESGAETGLRIKELHPHELRTLFALDGHAPGATALVFLPPEQMSAVDRDLAEGSQSEIVRRARLAGLGFGGTGDGWAYEQAVCPAFPEHIVLEYSRRRGPGDISLFAAVIPKGAGHIRVIPVSRRGFSLFTPAGSNGLTIHDFNAMVREESQGESRDWMSLGLCYAALAGGHVRAALLDGVPTREGFPMPAASMIEVSYQKSGAEVVIESAQPVQDARSWVLRFSGKGLLLKVALRKTPLLQLHAVADKALAPGRPAKEAGVLLPH